MKKLFIVALLLVSLLFISSCDKKCEHEWDLIETTTNCVKEGTATYRCSKCFERKTEKVEPLGHDFSVKKSIDVNNCSVVYKCSRCAQTTTDKHSSHTGNGICEHCGGNAIEIGKTICKEKGKWDNLYYQIYFYAYFEDSYCAQLQYEIENDSLWLTITDFSYSLGIMFDDTNSFTWFFLKGAFCNIKTLKETTSNYAVGTRGYEDVNFSTRNNPISSYTYAAFADSDIIKALQYANSLTSYALKYGSKLLKELDSYLTIEFLGFKNWEK